MPFDSETQKRIQQTRLDHLEFIFGFELKEHIRERMLAELREAFVEDGDWESQCLPPEGISEDEWIADFHDFLEDWLEEHRDEIVRAYVRAWDNMLRHPKTLKFTKPWRLWLVEMRRQREQERAA